MHWSQHAGTDTLFHLNNSNQLFADGKRLAISNSQFTYLLNAYQITSLTVSHEYHSGVTLEFTLASLGPIQTLRAGEVEDIFLDANQLSVDDLLKLIYQKLEKRTEDKPKTSAPPLLST